MSILIKGMEMPKHCGECGIEWCNRWKKLIVAGMSIAKTRPSDCPLVPVPEHGRLIDADALFDFILNLYKTAQGDARKVYSDVLDTIVAAGDVIPADKEGEG